MNTRKVIYQEEKFCTIENPKGKIGQFESYENGTIIIEEDNYPDKDTISNYLIGDRRRILLTGKKHPRYFKEFNKSIVNKSLDDSFYYPSETNQDESCYLYENFDNYILYIAIAVPVCYFICAFIVICIYCKYRKISNRYHRLVEFEGGYTETANDSQAPSKRGKTSQLEMSTKLEANSKRTNK